MGLFDRQKLFRGEKLTEAFAERERFILWDFAVVAEDNTEIVPGSTVDKVELVVSKEKGDGEPFLVSTLSGPIRDIAYLNVRDAKGKPKADDLPCICSWKRVETKASREGSRSEATVLEMLDPFSGKVPAELPAFSFPPITTDHNPLESVA